MGIVYAATHPTTDRPVAVKLLRAALAGNAQVGRRCLREARMMASVEDPRVVRIIDAGLFAPARPYVVMERLRGEDLARRLQRSPTLAIPDVLELARAAAGGLGAVHRVGLVHRDVKPGNLFRSDRGWKILDFGVAKSVALDAPVTLKDVVVGTPHYMAPEQVHGLPIGPACDVWALGVVLHRCLTGRYPFDGSSVAAIITAVSEGKRTRAADATRADAPRALVDLIEACLEHDVRRRPASMDVVLRWLDRIPAPRPGFVVGPDATLAGRLDTPPPPCGRRSAPPLDVQRRRGTGGDRGPDVRPYLGPRHRRPAVEATAVS